MKYRSNKAMCFCMMVSIVLSSCVKRKVFYAEQLAKTSAQGQVTALSKELYERKREAAGFVKDIAELNMRLGAQKKEISDLQGELAKRTELMGASSAKLLAEKRELEVNYNATVKTLENKEQEIAQLTEAENALKSVLSSDFAALELALASMSREDITITMNHDHLAILVPDHILFDREGLRISANAASFLLPFAAILAERPSYQVQIHAHVDNQIPQRNREITDTWAFAQYRALALVRTLVSNYNVNAYMLAPVARGEYSPIASNSTPEGRAQNRRTVFYIYTK